MATNMKLFFSLLLAVIFISNPVSAARWLIEPRSEDVAPSELDPQTFNISHYDNTKWNVTKLPDDTDIGSAELLKARQNTPEE
jgi:hypothetical protein